MDQTKVISNNPVVTVVETVTQIDCPNPSCNASLPIDNLKFGVSIQCAKCKNVTYNPFEPKHWWFRTRNFVLSLIGTLIIGIIAGLIANALWSKIVK